MDNTNFKSILKNIIDNKYEYTIFLKEKENKFYNLKKYIDYKIITYIPKNIEEFELNLIKIFEEYKKNRISQIKNNDFAQYDNYATEESINRTLRNITVGTYFSLNNISFKNEYSDENMLKAYLKYLQKTTTTCFAYFKVAHILGREEKEEIELVEKCYQANIILLSRVYNYMLDFLEVELEDKINLIKKLSTNSKKEFLFKICDKEDIDYLLGYLCKTEYNNLKKIKNEIYSCFSCDSYTNINDNAGLNYSYEKYLKSLTISQYLDKNPVDEFPQARKMNRHFIIHSGPTNSGKTYQALEDLKNASRGAYLAPLRLLAIEVQEKLMSENIKCDLLTGEEEMLVDNSTHTSSTPEKANYLTEYDVVVVDECQMIDDIDRGGYWTNAILGIKSKTIHLCTAPSAVNLLIKLIELCGDTYEHISHTRNTELLIDNKHFKSLDDCEKGDALIVFSKKNVLAVASVLLSKGIKTSIIYGALPYKSRKTQIEKFINGETDVIVATDAIGLGLNVPIKRVVFIDSYKFDGYQKRKLHTEEVKQIAGRAGRFGMYDVGYVNALNNLDDIKEKLTSSYWSINKAKLTLPESIIDVEGDLSENIKIWSEIDSIENFEKPNVNRVLFILSKLKELGYSTIGNYYSYKLATMYFKEQDNDVFNLWVKYLKDYFIELEDEMKKPKIEDYTDDLQGLESYNKSLELYYTFSKTFSLPLDLKWVADERLRVSQEINNILLEEIKKHKKTCNVCGTQLDWDSLDTKCVKCTLIEAMQNKDSNIRVSVNKRKK